MDHPPETEVDEGASPSLSRDQVRGTLRSVALFQGLGDADLEGILRISETVLVESGELVFEEGDRGDHFFIVVRGQIELRKRASDGVRRLAVLRAGQAFGEMALLNQTPRSASAIALEDTYILSVSRAAFGQILGGETLAVRLLRNLSRALWATSVRLAAQQAQAASGTAPREALADFNRLLRSRLLPRVVPRVHGYDLAAATSAPRQGAGSAGWDWLVLADGRPLLVVMRATRPDVFSAQCLAALRTVLRTLADEPQSSLGALVTKASRGVRSGWIEGLSGPVTCAFAALGEEAVDVVATGETGALLVRTSGESQDLVATAPAVGERGNHTYESKSIPLGKGDKVILLSHARPDLGHVVASVVAEGYTSSSRDALNKLFLALSVEDGARGGTDLTGAVITRAKTS
jgi:CRP-like cAMP-binding protein